jgi:hypothetical protein
MNTLRDFYDNPTWKEVLLTEGRKDDVSKKYPWMASISMDYQAGAVDIAFPSMTPLKYLSDSDPSGNNKYLMWMADRYAESMDERIYAQRIFTKAAYTPEPGEIDKLRQSVVETSGPYLAKTINVVQQFHLLVPYFKNKDLYSYKNFGDVIHATQEAREKRAAKEQKKAIKDVAKAGGREIWKHGKVTVIRPLTKEASCLFGQQTKWCISATQSDENWWQRYSNEGKSFYFIHMPKHIWEHWQRIALVIENGHIESIYDATDEPMDIENLQQAWIAYKQHVSGRTSITDVVDEWTDLYHQMLKACIDDAIKDPVERILDLDDAQEIMDSLYMDGALHTIDLDEDDDAVVVADAYIKFFFYVEPELALKIRKYEEADRNRKELIHPTTGRKMKPPSSNRGEIQEQMIRNEVRKIVEKVMTNTPLGDAGYAISLPEIHYQRDVDYDYNAQRGIETYMEPMDTIRFKVTNAKKLGFERFTKSKEFEEWVEHIKETEGGMMDYFFPDREYHSALSDRQEMTEEIFGTFFYSSLKDAGIAATRAKHTKSAEQQAARNLKATEPPF